MPRELPIEPCPPQQQLLESRGFEFDAESWDFPVVTWYAHGVTLKLWKESDAPSMPEVVTAIVQQARADGAIEARRTVQKALGIIP